MKRTLFVLLAVLCLSLIASAQDMPTASVEVADQFIGDNKVRINSVYSDGPGFVVIHIDNNGGPGPVAGWRAVPAGWTHGLDIWIDPTLATPTLFAMLHVDDGEIGVYEFGTVEGADSPAMADGAMVNPSFSIELISAWNQLDASTEVVIGNVVTNQDGWIAIHSGPEGRPGPVVGSAPVTAGNNANVVVALSGDVTPQLFPMTHIDDGVIGTYEFGAVEGADAPVRVNGVVAVTGLYQGSPSMIVGDQIVTDQLVAEQVISDGPGWLAIHSDGGGSPGPVIGQAAVANGSNANVVVAVDPAGVTAVLYPMLHVDTGVVGEYEFGTVEGADGPVRVNDAVLVFAINAAPTIDYTVERVDSDTGTQLIVGGATIDAPGWMAIHADNGGSPGAVLGFARLQTGYNSSIVVDVTTEGLTDTVFPMLHYDTGELGVYEFGTVEGADGPVRVGDAVVTGPAAVMVR